MSSFTVKGSILGIAGLLVFMFAYGGYYVVPEGHVGVVKRFAKASHQSTAGLHFKVPFIDSVEKFEVRQRKNTEELTASTGDQLPISAGVSINWTVDPSAAMDIFINYGGLAQFESRILDPKFRSVTKAALSKFSASELIRNRMEVVNLIQDGMQEAMSDFPITINSPQIENITLPNTYMNAILAKEEARESAKKEEHTLLQQKLRALQEVNTAEAAKQAKQLKAEGNAYAITVQAKAEAEATKLKGEAEAIRLGMINTALNKDPLLVAYIKAKQWDGVMPKTVLGASPSILMSLDK